ncbi:MAG: 2'-5' RNA ligase family protein, partial [Planctomycetota bacterium]
MLLASGEAAELADRIRCRFDSEWFERVPPHVSLAGPFDPDEAAAAGMTDAKLARLLEEAVGRVDPFFLELGPPQTFIVPRLVLFFSVVDEGPVHELERRLRETVPCCASSLEFSPHLTVGRLASQDAVRRALAEAGAEFAKRPADAGAFGFPVDEVHLFGED